jgi:hypothetical protein
MATFNFASYYMNTALSDVEIKIKLADGSPVQADLPGHGILLSNVSPLFKEEIEDKGTITLEISKVYIQGAITLCIALGSTAKRHSLVAQLCGMHCAVATTTAQKPAAHSIVKSRHLS